MTTLTHPLLFHQTLIDQDIEGSIAHATMLANQGIISQQDSEQIIQGLKSIQHDYHQDQIQFSASLEDIHLNIEHELIKRIGDAGGKLHGSVETIKLHNTCTCTLRNKCKISSH
ncbi:hypothetical protein ACVPOQ_13515 [Staphylococcus aureus]